MRGLLWALAALDAATIAAVSVRGATAPAQRADEFLGWLNHLSDELLYLTIFPLFLGMVLALWATPGGPRAFPGAVINLVTGIPSLALIGVSVAMERPPPAIVAFCSSAAVVLLAVKIVWRSRPNARTDEGTLPRAQVNGGKVQG